MEKKLAIVASGGGMKCSYGAGAVVALGKFFEVRPDIFVAGSGGSGGLSFYASEQYDSIQNIWTNLITGKRFINKRRLSKIANVDYLIDDVFKVQDPLNAEAVMNSGIDCRIAVTNAETGKVEHFSPLECDVFELMRASMAMPLVYGKKIPLNGNLYHDSYASSFLGLNLEKAISLGAKKIIAINNSRFGNMDRCIFKV